MINCKEDRIPHLKNNAYIYGEVLSQTQPSLKDLILNSSSRTAIKITENFKQKPLEEKILNLDAEIRPIRLAFDDSSLRIKGLSELVEAQSFKTEISQIYHKSSSENTENE